jgi:hypothetical protein
VNVEKVEIAELGNLEHARGQCQIVWGKLEKRVTGDGNFVIEDAVVTSAQAERLRVGDEMDLVTRGGKFYSEFGGYNTGAAVRGITGDADAHAAALPSED